MLFTLLIWIYASVITFLAGDVLLRIGRKLTGPMPTVSAPFVCLLGTAGLTVVLGWAWLVMPINLTTHLVLAGALLGYAAWYRPQPRWNFPHWKTPWLGWLLVGVLFMVVWIRSVQLPRLADTGGYHAPMIEWIHQYAIVPGLANLNYRFGFNNSWFLFSTFFRFQLAPNVPWHGLNGWLMVMMGWFSLTEWHRYATDHRPFSAMLGSGLALGFLVIFHWTLSSPSPDLPTHVYVVLCFWVWLRRAESGWAPYAVSWAWLLILLSMAALTAKLSAVTVLLLPALIVGQTLIRGDWRRLLLFGLTVLVFTGYWWVGNVILSGYIAYPSLSSLVDWWPLDWKVPCGVIATGLRNLQQGTRGDLGPALSLAWVPYWFKTRPVLEQGIFVLLLLVLPMFLRYRKRVSGVIPGYGVAWVIAWTGVVFWFFLAPEIRFGAGNVLIVIGLAFGPVVSRSTSQRGWIPAGGLSMICLLGLALLLAAVRREPIGWLTPAGYPARPLSAYRADAHLVVYPTDDLRVINGIRGYWGSCYDTTLPCSPYPIPGLRWRGQTLQNGFRTTESIGR